MSDPNLTDLISRAVAQRMTPEFVETEVDTRVQKLLVESIDRALRSYSDTGKLIEKAVEDALRVNHLDLPSYGSIVAAMVKTQIETRVADVVAGRLAQDVDELLGLAPKEITLSEIAKEMLEYSDVEYGDAITIIVDTPKYGSRWLFLDEEAPDKEEYRCKHRLLIREDGTIAGAYTGESKDRKWIGKAYGIEQKIRAWVACGTKIVIDTEHPCIGKGDY